MNNRENHWYRNRDFFVPLEPHRHITVDNQVVEDRSPSEINQFVLFNNSQSTAATIRAIEITRYLDGNTKVRIKPAEYSIDELIDLCELAGFTKDEIDIDRNNSFCITFKIKPKQDAKKLTNLLRDLNTKYHRKEFTESLLTDLETIFGVNTESKEPPVHVVPFSDPSLKKTNWFYNWNTTPHTWVNEERNPLLHYLTECMWSRETFSMTKYEELLRQGHNPNDVGSTGTNLLTFALEQDDKEILKKALYYKANPFEFMEVAGSATTPFEIARSRMQCASDANNMQELTQLMLDHCGRKPDIDLEPLRVDNRLTPPHKRIEKPLFNFNNYSVFTRGDRIHTCFPHSPIQFELCSTSALSESEQAEIYKLYQEHFEPSPVINKDLEEFYASEFTGKSKFVEKVSSNGQLLGVNLYEIITDQRYPDLIFFHISCIFMDESLRGQGLTNPLVFTLGLALQMLFPDKYIIGALQSISYGSANLVKDLTYFPKYSGPLEKFAEVLIPHIQRPLKEPGPLLIKNPDNPISCYSEIEVQNTVKKAPDSKEKPTEPVDLNKDNYESQRDRRPAPANSIHRGVLVMFAISDELWMQYALLCLRMNINPFEYVKAFAIEFTKLPNSDLKSNTDMRLFVPKNSSFLSNGTIERLEANQLLRNFTR